MLYVIQQKARQHCFQMYCNIKVTFFPLSGGRCWAQLKAKLIENDSTPFLDPALSLPLYEKQEYPLISEEDVEWQYKIPGHANLS